MSRINAADADAITLLAFFVYFFAILAFGAALYWIAERMTRNRWPQGHGNSYWSTPKRVNDE